MSSQPELNRQQREQLLQRLAEARLDLLMENSVTIALFKVIEWLRLVVIKRGEYDIQSGKYSNIQNVISIHDLEILEEIARGLSSAIRMEAMITGSTSVSCSSTFHDLSSLAGWIETIKDTYLLPQIAGKQQLAIKSNHHKPESWVHDRLDSSVDLSQLAYMLNSTDNSPTIILLMFVVVCEKNHVVGELPDAELEMIFAYMNKAFTGNQLRIRSEANGALMQKIQQISEQNLPIAPTMREIINELMANSDFSESYQGLREEYNAIKFMENMRLIFLSVSTVNQPQIEIPESLY